MDSSGSITADQIDAENYRDAIGKSVQKTSCLKSPYNKPMGFPSVCSADPLARLKDSERIGIAHTNDKPPLACIPACNSCSFGFGEAG